MNVTERLTNCRVRFHVNNASPDTPKHTPLKKPKGVLRLYLFGADEVKISWDPASRFLQHRYLNKVENIIFSIIYAQTLFPFVKCCACVRA